MSYWTSLKRLKLKMLFIILKLLEYAYLITFKGSRILKLKSQCHFLNKEGAVVMMWNLLIITE